MLKLAKYYLRLGPFLFTIILTQSLWRFIIFILQKYLAITVTVIIFFLYCVAEQFSNGYVIYIFKNVSINS